MELINSNSEMIKEFFQSMDRMLDGISRLAKESRPHLNGEKFLRSSQISESKHPHAARMARYGRYPLHSDKRQNNLPSKRYRTAFADLLQQGTAGITHRPKKHIFSETD